MAQFRVPRPQSPVPIEPGSIWSIANCSGGYSLWDDQYVPLAGRQIAKYYGGSLTEFVHPNHVGSTSIVTDQTGAAARDMMFYPFGQVWQQWGSNYDTHFAAFQQREFVSGLDPTPNRMYHSRLFRWMTPDPVGGHTEDPQTLNRYAYVRNNPLNLTDPAGLDFYLTCTQTGENKSTCQGGHSGTTNDKGEFTATVVTSASLSDPKSGNTARVTENGLLITTAQGTFQGIFISKTPAADIQGSSQLQDFSFHVDSSDEKSGTFAAGTYTYEKSSDQPDIVDILKERGAFSYRAEATAFGNPKHKGELNFRFSSGAHPNLFDYGPSPHLLVPNNPKVTVPAGSGWNFHIDSHTGTFRHGACAHLGLGCQ